MLSQEQICDLTIDLEAGKQALAAADRRLADLLDGSKTLDAKAQGLFTAFNMLSLAAIGAASVLWSSTTVPAGATWAMIGAAIMLIFGSVSCVLALIPRKTGSLGSEPAVWLREGTINVAAGHVPVVLALMAQAHDGRIQKTFDANELKAGWVILAMWLGMSAPIVAAVILIFFPR